MRLKETLFIAVLVVLLLAYVGYHEIQRAPNINPTLVPQPANAEESIAHVRKIREQQFRQAQREMLPNPEDSFCDAVQAADGWDTRTMSQRKYNDSPESIAFSLTLSGVTEEEIIEEIRRRKQLLVDALTHNAAHSKILEQCGSTTFLQVMAINEGYAPNVILPRNIRVRVTQMGGMQFPHQTREDLYSEDQWTQTRALADLKTDTRLYQLTNSEIRKLGFNKQITDSLLKK